MKSNQFKTTYFAVFSLVVFLIFLFLNQEIFFKKQDENKPLLFHNSYFSQKYFFEEAFKFANNPGYIPLAKGILVNHHLLASSYIAEAFNSVATSAPVTVLLISPNHFSAGRGNFITSQAFWKTPYGILEPDLELVTKLKKAQLVNIQESPFENEHGISGIVAFLKKTLPNAKVVPIIVHNRTKLEEVKKVADEVTKFLPSNFLVVGSFDFSHYLTSRVADFHDQLSLNAVENFDYDSMQKLDIDSWQGLVLSEKILENIGAKKFNKLQHSNSAHLTKREQELETTSYITGYFSQEVAEKGKPLLTTLVLPPIENFPEVLNSFNRYEKDWSIEYLERFFFGQSRTIAALFNSQEKIKSILRSYRVNEVVENQNTYEPIKKVVFLENAKKDSIILKNESLKIYRSNSLFAKNTFKQAKNCFAYGFLENGQDLEVYIFAMELRDGKARLLAPKTESMLLFNLAKNSTGLETKEIKTGKLILKNFNNLK